MWKPPRLPSQTTRGRPLFMKGSSKRILCQSSISSIRAMWMPSYCTTESRDYGIDLVGPTRPDVKWQAQQQTGFDAGHFAIDWQAEQATCPEGHRSISWTPAIDNRKNEGDLDQVLDHRLSGLPQSFLVYALNSDPASDHHSAS